MNDDELEQAVREGLDRRAELADVDVPVLSRAVSDARSRRWRPLLAIGGAAAAAALVVGVVVRLADGGGAIADRVVDPSTPSDAQGPWRTERWGSLQVDVPADWGYGGAPDDEGIACFPAPMLDAAGSPVSGQPPEGYVGRPITLTDVCDASTGAREPESSYVWLGAGLQPGTVELPGGYTQETVEVQGSTLTVATQDAALRARILGSARGNEMCLSELDRSGAIAHDRTDDPQAQPVALRVCAYRLGRGVEDGWQLTYAAEFGRGALRAYLAALEDGEPPRDQCPTVDYQLEEAVVLELLDDGGRVVRQDAVNTFGSCAGIGVDATKVWELRTTRLTDDMVLPWAVGGVRAVVHGPAGLIGPQG